MRTLFRHRRSAHRVIGTAVLLAASIDLSGCAPGYIEEAGYPENLCGFLFACGSDRDNNRGGEQTAVGTSSDGSSSDGSSTGQGGGESAATAGAQ